MKLSKGYVLRDVMGEKVIMAEGLEASVNFGRLQCLNETAAWLWEEAGRPHDLSAASLTACLCHEYNVSQEKAGKDVSAIIIQWQEKGLVED